jgi:hypothetical protein
MYAHMNTYKTFILNSKPAHMNTYIIKNYKTYNNVKPLCLTKNT